MEENVVEQLSYCFSEALDRGDIEGARSIISHVKDLDVLSAKVLESELLDLPISSFATN